jgi:hypothetical protein
MYTQFPICGLRRFSSFHCSFVALTTGLGCFGGHFAAFSGCLFTGFALPSDHVVSSYDGCLLDYFQGNEFIYCLLTGLSFSLPSLLILHEDAGSERIPRGLHQIDEVSRPAQLFTQGADQEREEHHHCRPPVELD